MDCESSLTCASSGAVHVWRMGTVAAYAEHFESLTYEEADYVGVILQCSALILVCCLLIWLCVDVLGISVCLKLWCSLVLHDDRFIRLWSSVFRRPAQSLKLFFWMCRMDILSSDCVFSVLKWVYSIRCWCCRLSRRCHWIKSEAVTRLVYFVVFFPEVNEVKSVIFLPFLS